MRREEIIWIYSTPSSFENLGEFLKEEGKKEEEKKQRIRRTITERKFTIIFFYCRINDLGRLYQRQ